MAPAIELGMPDSMIDLDGGLSPPRQRERKFLLEPTVAQAFWAVASRHLPAQPQDAARPYTFVRTGYFDTPDLEYYRSCRGAVARRLRVREYAVMARPGGVPELCAVCYLELKQSTRGERVKMRVPLRAADVAAQLGKLSDAPLAPVVTTWYQRRALGDDGAGLRVTLDQSIRFCAPIPVGTPIQSSEPPRVFAAGPPCVLEVKLWGAAPAWLASQLGPLTESLRFSKFTAGMQAAEDCGLLGDAGWGQSQSSVAHAL